MDFNIPASKKKDLPVASVRNNLGVVTQAQIISNNRKNEIFHNIVMGLGISDNGKRGLIDKWSAVDNEAKKDAILTKIIQAKVAIQDAIPPTVTPDEYVQIMHEHDYVMSIFFAKHYNG